MGRTLYIQILLILFSFSIFLSCKPNNNSNADNAVVVNIKWNNYQIGILDSIILNKTEYILDDSSFSYGAYFKLPKLLSTGPNGSSLNIKIEQDFAEVILQQSNNPFADKERFVKIAYDYYVQDTILSLVVYELNAFHLSEGTSRYEVYHYDFKNDKFLTTRDLIEAWGMSQVPLLNAIAEQIVMPPDNNEPLFNTEWFQDIKWKDINQLKLYKNSLGQIVVIYPVIENGIEAEQTIE